MRSIVEKSIFAIVSAGLFVLTVNARGQTGSLASNGKTAVNPVALHRYLRQPNGIEKLSAVAGDVFLDEEEEHWGEDSIASLTSRSESVVVGKILSTASRLHEDGDSIESTYSVQIQESLKGSRSEVTSFHVVGGTVALPSGHLATLHTPASDGLKEGQIYLLFLHSESGGVWLTSGSHGAMYLNSAANRAELLDRPDAPASHLANVLASATIASVEDEVHNAAVAH